MFRRVLIAAVMTAGLCDIATAQDDPCEKEFGGSGVFEIVDWTAEPAGDRTAITVTYRNVSGRAVEMASATAWFRDALGRSVGGIGLDQDPKLAPEAETTETFQMPGMQRLYEVDRANIVAAVCVEEALFADGTKEELE